MAAPFVFCCAKCRVGQGQWKSDRGWKRCTRTGQKKHRTTKTGRTIQWEYHCGDCGHTGWSNHPSVPNLPLKESKP